MHAASTLLAVLLLGGDPHPASSIRAEDAGVRVQFRLLTMKGLDWRGPLHHRLTPAARQGTATIWTANQDVLEPLRKAADSTMQAPTVCANLGATVHLEDARVVNLVADLRRVADGPPGESTSVAFAPEVDALRDGFEADVSCRKVDQGLMVRLACSDTRVAAIHCYAIQDGATDPKTKKVSPIRAQIQVPEVVTNRAEGEWLVPTSGVLVVSLGAYTCDDGHGKAVTRERLAVIEPRLPKDDFEVARSGLDPAASPALARPFFQGSAVRPLAPPAPIGTSMLLPIASPTVAPRAEDKPADKSRSITVTAIAVPGFPLPFFAIGTSVESAEVAPHAALPKATPPGRNLPTPISVDGSVLALPPLPDEEAEPASSSPDGTARPAPQAKTAPSPDVPKPQAATSPHLRALTRQAEANLAAWTAAKPGLRESKSLIDARGVAVMVRDGSLPVREMVCNDLVLYPAHDGSRDDCVRDNLAGPSTLPESPVPARGSPLVTAVSEGFRHPGRAPRIDNSILPALFPAESFWGAGPAFRCIACSRPDGPDAAIEDDACLAETGSLDFQVKTAEGDCRYDGRVRLKMIGAEPVVARVPMADGSVVEIQAKVVNKAASAK